MASADYVTVTFGAGNDHDGDEVKIIGKDLPGVSNENRTQIVTVVDGGDMDDNDNDGEGATYLFEFFGKTTNDNDEFKFDLSGFDDDFSIAVKSMDPGDTFYFSGADSHTVVGSVWTIEYTGSDGSPHTITMDSQSQNSGFGEATVVVCFAKGTTICVPDGEVAVEDLSAGDTVICGDGTTREILWIGGRKVNADRLLQNPNLRPVLFQADALGVGCPDRPLRLSPQHRVMLNDWRAELLFGENEVLAPAIALLNDTSITRDHEREEIEYFHILLYGHHTVFANGVECETLMPAEMALTAMSGEAREEIFMLFPEMAADLVSFGSTYRCVLKPYEVCAMLG